jgi:hypothetical protein
MPANYVYALSEAQNHACCYCHHLMLIHHKQAKYETAPSNLLTKDHVNPRCYGGPTHADNLVAACGQCNWIRGALDAETFYILIQLWFNNDLLLHKRWHTISRLEYIHFKRECERIDKLQWRRRIKKCAGAIALDTLVAIPLPSHQTRA